MHHFHYRDLRRRIEALEAHFLPDPGPPPPMIVIPDGDGAPDCILIPDRFHWVRNTGKPLPPDIFARLSPESRAAHEARIARENAPPQKATPQDQPGP